MIRIWTVSVVMFLCVWGSWWLAQGRLAAGDAMPALEDLIPLEFGEWRFDETVRPVLPRESENAELVAARIYDQILVRTYRNLDDERIMLVIAYGRNQSDAVQLHLPEICYASQGFSVTGVGRATIPVEPIGALPVKRLTTQRGRRHEPVTYWTRVGDRISLSTLGRQWAKLSFGLRRQVPDGVLIRVSSISRQSQHAFAVQERFVRDLLNTVDPAQLPFLLGRRVDPAEES